jgi:hypothetical protein
MRGRKNGNSGEVDGVGVETKRAVPSPGVLFLIAVFVRDVLSPFNFVGMHLLPSADHGKGTR